MDTASIDCSEPARWSRDSKRGCLHAAAYLSSVSLLALTLLPQVARADNECGTGTTVVCSPSGNPYANGIRYNSSSGQNLSFEPGVAVDTANDGLYISNGTAGDIVINTSAGTVTTSGDYRYGINASNNAGGVTVTTGDVTASGTWASGISAWSANGPVVIDTTAGTVAGRGTGIYASGNGLTITTADVGSSDGFSHAINAATYGTGNVLVDTTAGTVSTQGESSFGIFVNDGSGSPSLTTRVVTGDISTAGPEGSSGIVIRSSGIVEVDTTAGTVSTQGVQSSGIAVVAGFGNDNDGPAARSIDIRSGAITTAGAESAGIHVYGQQSAVTIDTTAGAIETRGASSAGLLVGNAAGDVSIRAGRIATSGEAAYGIAVTSEDEGVTGTYRTEVVATQPITVTGANAGGIAVRDVGSGGPVTVTAEANVTAQGQNAVGIAAGSFHAPVAVTVNSGATVMGGWSQSPDDLSTGASTSGASSMTRIGGGLPAAGIVLFSGAAEGARLTNNGTIGAMNDRAVTMGFPCATRGRASGGGSSASFNMTPTAPGGKSWLGTFASAIMEAIVPSARAAAPPAERGCGDG
ncbi:beta strand repeat-containing protein, partial [Phreatobacter sp. AB_2022a]|uniref:beta strand repeat-containing protein n=1 Tax=Phreatobacter sp. AB_2022a TaxID=3003134 RepID=UPI0022875D72